MKIITAILSQIERASLVEIVPDTPQEPGDLVVGTLTCEESRQLYRLWRKANTVQSKKIQKMKALFWAGTAPESPVVRRFMLEEIKIDCLRKLLLASICHDFPEALLELDKELLLCNGWTVVLRARAETVEECHDPACPVHGQSPVIGIMRKGEC